MTTPLGSGAPPDWVANQVYPIGVAVVHGGVLYRAIAVNDNDAPPSSSWTAIVSGGGGGTPGGNPGDLQYNNSGSFGGAIVSQVSTSELNVAVPTGDPMRIIPLVSNYDNESALLFNETGVHTSIILSPDFTNTSTFTGVTFTSIRSSDTQLEVETIDASGSGVPGRITFATGTNQTSRFVMIDSDGGASSTLQLQVASNGGNTSLLLDGDTSTTTVAGTLNVLTAYQINGAPGASGTFTTADAKTVTVTNGLITSIV